MSDDYIIEALHAAAVSPTSFDPALFSDAAERFRAALQRAERAEQKAQQYASHVDLHNQHTMTALNLTGSRIAQLEEQLASVIYLLEQCESEYPSRFRDVQARMAQLVAMQADGEGEGAG